MIKPVIYENSEMNVLATEFAYGLNALLSDQQSMTNISHNNQNNILSYTASNGTYYSAYKNKALSGIFQTTSKWSSSSVQLQVFKDMNAFPWLCKGVLGATECATISYNWDEVLIRPVSSQFKISANFFPGIPEQIFSFQEGQVLGVSEIVTMELISSASSCPSLLDLPVNLMA